MSQDSSADPRQPAGDPPPPTAPPKKRRRWLTITLITAAAAAVVVVVGAYLLVSSLREELPEAGDCLTDAPDPNDMTTVECDSDQAAWSVIGADGTMTQLDFQALTPEDEVCQEYEGTEQALWVTDAWFVDDSTEGTVVCLRRVGAGEPEPAESGPAESGSAGSSPAEPGAAEPGSG